MTNPDNTQVGIVYSPSGEPRIDAGFIDSLNPIQRRWVEENLSENGYNINQDGTVAKAT